MIRQLVQHRMAAAVATPASEETAVKKGKKGKKSLGVIGVITIYLYNFAYVYIYICIHNYCHCFSIHKMYAYVFLFLHIYIYIWCLWHTMWNVGKQMWSIVGFFMGTHSIFIPATSQPEVHDCSPRISLWRIPKSQMCQPSLHDEWHRSDFSMLDRWLDPHHWSCSVPFLRPMTY